MAEQTGTADNYIDLWEQLKTFLTTSPNDWVLENENEDAYSGTADGGSDATTIVDAGTDFVAEGFEIGDLIYNVTEGKYERILTVGAPDVNTLTTDGSGSVTDWTGDTFKYFTSSEMYLKGIGAGGTDSIHVNIRHEKDVPDDIYRWSIKGAIAYDGGEDFDDQPQASPDLYYVIPKEPMQYWFYANSRRFIVMIERSGRYTGMYAGFILPQATPSEYGYPLLLAATTGSTALKFEVDNVDNSSFFAPTRNDSAYLRTIDAQWQVINNYDTNHTLDEKNLWPWAQDQRQNLTRTPDGVYPLFEATIRLSAPFNTVGILDGVFFCPGDGTPSGDTIVDGGDTFYIFHDVFRVDDNDYVAIKGG